jgi:hypothetical protein
VFLCVDLCVLCGKKGGLKIPETSTQKPAPSTRQHFINLPPSFSILLPFHQPIQLINSINAENYRIFAIFTGNYAASLNGMLFHFIRKYNESTEIRRYITRIP